MISLKPPFRAKDMEGLYKKIIKGHFNPIPDTFSSDLGAVVALLLNTDAQKRPDCAQILAHPIVQKRMHMYFGEEFDDKSTEASDLLKTILFPRNFMNLTDKLPKASYEEQHLE